MNFFFFIIFFIQHVAASSHSYSSIKDSYETWCVGSCTTDVTTSTTPGAVLMGGGTDTDEAFEWQIKNVNGGDFVILRASGDDAYNDYVYDLSVASGNKLNSVTTILFKNGDASSESYVLTLIENAEAIFFAGGDQYEYLSYWRDTDVQRIIQNKLQNITIGGTSAGLAVLGNWVYSAEEGSVYSDEALEDPYNKYITIVPALLHIPFMETIITDTHFKTRDRMGRMLTFVARILEDDNNSTVARGVGVDEHTALLLDTLTGIFHVFLVRLSLKTK
jgi:cyanophycinase